MRWTALFLLSAGCVDVPLLQVDVTGELELGAAWQGPLNAQVQLHHAWQGEGVLRHPFGELARLDAEAPGEFATQLLYPEEEGEGLLVYAWADLNDDGVLCAPGTPDEPAGLIEVSDFPDFEVHAQVLLNRPCAGPEMLYP